MNDPTYRTGKICYVEIPSDDPAQSAEFYRQAFGWHIRQRGDGSTAFDDSVSEVSGTWVQGRRADAHPLVLRAGAVPRQRLRPAARDQRVVVTSAEC